MPSNYDETDEFIKSLGRKPPPDPALAPPPKTTAPAPAPTPAPSTAPSIGPPSAQAAPAPSDPSGEASFRPSARHASETRGQVMRGLGRGGLRLLGNIPHARERIQFSPTLRDLAAENPNASTAERAAEVVGEQGPLLMNPLGKVGQAAKAITLSSKAPVMPIWLGRAANRWALGTQAAANAASGAAGGAVANPEDPGAGAITGAIGGVAGPAAGSLLRTARGQRIGGMLARELPFFGLHKATGLPYYPFVGPLSTHMAGLGGPMRMVGENIVAASGQTLGRISPVFQGYVAAQVDKGVDVASVIRDLYAQYGPEIFANAQKPRSQEPQQ